MDDDRRTKIQITRKPGDAEVSIINGAIKIKASEKPVATRFVPAPARVYILLDCSGSMKGKKIDQAKAGIIDFARDAFKKGYEVGLITFGDKAQLLSEPSRDITLLQKALPGIRGYGSTNMTAALTIALTQFKTFTGAKAIVVATDGMPDSVKSSLEVATSAKAAGIDIIAIGTDDADKEFLKKLASRTELSSKVSSDAFSQAIFEASRLLATPEQFTSK